MSKNVKSIDLEAIKRSSSFRVGTFEVPMGDAGSLPGRRSPADLYDSLGLKEVEGSVVSIFCESGGLLTEALHRGAEKAIGFEDRYWSIEALRTVTKNYPERHLISIWDRMPFECSWGEGIDLLSDSCSVVFMTEGWQNYCRYPIKLLKTAFGLLKPGGMMVVELTVGRNKAPDEPTNAWYPSMQVFKRSLSEWLGVTSFEIQDGKLEGRFICCLCKAIDTIDAIKSEDDLVVVADDENAEDEPEVTESRLVFDEKTKPEPKPEPESKSQETPSEKRKETKKVKDPNAVARAKAGWETRRKNAEAKAAAEKQQE